MDMIVKDRPQTPLLEAIAYGRASNVFDGLFLEQLREEAVKMTIGFAQKYYNAHYESSLRLARDIVLGVCNLGLAISTDADVAKAAAVLREEGLLQIFRKGFSALQKLADMSKDVMYTIQNLCLEVAYTNGGKPWEGFAQYNEIKSIIEHDVSCKTFLAAYAGRFGDREQQEKIAVTKLIAAVSVVGNNSGTLTLADVRRCIAVLMQIDEDLVWKRIGAIRGAVQHAQQQGFDVVAKEAVDLIARIRTRDITASAYILLQELNVHHDADQVVALDVSIIAQLPKEELLESLRMGLAHDLSAYITAVMKCDLTMRELISVIDVCVDLRMMHGKVRWHMYRDKQIATLMFREFNLQRMHMLMVDWARYMHERTSSLTWGMLVGEHMIAYITQCHPTIILVLSQYMVLSTRQINQRDDVGHAPFLLCDPYEFYIESRSGDESCLFTVHADVLACAGDSDYGDERLRSLLAQIIAGLKKGKIKKTDPVYYDRTLRTHIQKSRAKKMYERLLGT